MNKRNDVEVIINNKRYTLCGYESEEYLQKVASYINGKISNLKHQEAYRSMDGEMRNVLTQINLADDYFKIKKQLEEIETDGNNKSNEIYGLKHEIVDLRTKLEVAEREIKSLKSENIAAQKHLIKLETELAMEAEKDREKKNELIETSLDVTINDDMEEF